MEITTTLATTVTGGVLQSTIQAVLGPAAWATTMAMLPATASAIKVMGCLLGTSGIDFPSILQD